MYYRDAHAVVLVYDITDPSSFEEVSGWLTEIQKQGNARIQVLLLGNKCDLESHRLVDHAEGKAFAEQHGLTFFETSAATSHNVNTAFYEVAQKCVELMVNAPAVKPRGNIAVDIDQNYTPDVTKRKCC